MKHMLHVEWQNLEKKVYENTVVVRSCSNHCQEKPFQKLCYERTSSLARLFKCMKAKEAQKKHVT